MSLESFQVGPGGAGRFARFSGRNPYNQSLGAIRYPSPFFDIAHMYLPSSFKALLKWCRYYFLTNPLINAVVYKMAEYPVTDLIFDTRNKSLHDKWSFFFDNILQFKKFLVECGLDYYTYGNCFISIFYPFRKHLKCKKCNYPIRVDKQKYSFQNFEFVGECSKCGNHGVFEAYDYYIRSAREIRLVRWNPEYVTVQHSDATGDSDYYYTIPPTDQNDIRMGKRHVIERCPQIFIDTLRNNKNLKFSKDNFFHMRRPTIAQKDRGWGLPMILPVLKDTFYLQVLRKAQETIAIEHIVPMRILFPQAASASADPYQTVNLASWRGRVEKELLRWRLDNNYIPIMPLPIGQQTLGGDGRALMLAQEYRVWSEHIVAGMGVPVEFVWGGLSYSGSNVSMRMLENHFVEDRSNHHKLVDHFIMPNVGAYMGWQPINSHFRKFKMADDLQRSAFNLQLNQAGKLSDRTLLEEIDWNSDDEADRIADEHKQVLETQRQGSISQAVIQGESQLIMQKYQMRGQKMMEAAQPPMQPAGPGQPMPGQQPLALPPGPGAGGASEAPPGIPPEMGGAPMPGPAGAPLPGAQSPLNAEQQGPGPDEMHSMDLMAIAQKIVAFLDQMSDQEKMPYLAQLQKGNPQLHAVVLQMLSQRTGAHQSSAATAQPKQKPARRGPEAQAV